jgi:antitoxin ParD1/3/4
MRAKIREAIDDPRPDIPAADVFARLRARHADGQ